MSGRGRRCLGWLRQERQRHRRAMQYEETGEGDHIDEKDSRDDLGREGRERAADRNPVGEEPDFIDGIGNDERKAKSKQGWDVQPYRPLRGEKSGHGRRSDGAAPAERAYVERIAKDAEADELVREPSRHDEGYTLDAAHREGGERGNRREGSGTGKREAPADSQRGNEDNPQSQQRHRRFGVSVVHRHVLPRMKQSLSSLRLGRGNRPRDLFVRTSDANTASTSSISKSPLCRPPRGNRWRLGRRRQVWRGLRATRRQTRGTMGEDEYAPL